MAGYSDGQANYARRAATNTHTAGHCQPRGAPDRALRSAPFEQDDQLLSEPWSQTTESIQRILVWRGLAGQKRQRSGRLVPAARAPDADRNGLSREGQTSRSAGTRLSPTAVHSGGVRRRSLDVQTTAIAGLDSVTSQTSDNGH